MKTPNFLYILLCCRDPVEGARAAMGVIVLDLYPGLEISPFSLGRPSRCNHVWVKTKSTTAIITNHCRTMKHTLYMWLLVFYLHTRITWSLLLPI
ncbi:hypothetical protein Hanom_Chr06g00568041 [Helianthus anomalus]